jgi:hypothetical protein
MKRLAAGLAFWLAVCGLSAQPAAIQGKPWKRHVIDDASRGCDGARFMDIDGDGLLDCVTGWEEGGQVRAV